MFKRKPRVYTPEEMEAIRTKDFFDWHRPRRCEILHRPLYCWKLLPLRLGGARVSAQYGGAGDSVQLADRSGVTLRIYHRLVESTEQRKILQNATRKNQLMSGGRDVSETIEAQGNLQDVVELLANLRKNKEPLLHCAVFWS